MMPNRRVFIAARTPSSARFAVTARGEVGFDVQKRDLD
jgi:hypothetical protein